MSYEIIYSEQFKEKLIATREYIAENFSQKVANNFLDEVEAKIERLIEQPEIGMMSAKEKGVRRLLVGKYNAIFYRISGKRIEIADLFDQRQDPSKSKF